MKKRIILAAIAVGCVVGARPADMTIAKLHELTENQEQINLTITDGKVVFIDTRGDKPNVFVRDGGKAVMFYGTDIPFKLVTYMENTTRVKPSPTYYLACAEALGFAPEEILMVGNDPKRDFPTPDCGIQTAYVGHGRRPVRATWAGSMEEFARSFDEVEERFAAYAERRLLDIVQDTSAGR